MAKNAAAVSPPSRWNTVGFFLNTKKKTLLTLDDKRNKKLYQRNNSSVMSHPAVRLHSLQRRVPVLDVRLRLANSEVCSANSSERTSGLDLQDKRHVKKNIYIYSILYGVFVIRDIGFCDVKTFFFFKFCGSFLQISSALFSLLDTHSPLLFLALSELDPRNEHIINKKRPFLSSAFVPKCLFSEKLMQTPSTRNFSLRGGYLAPPL